MTTRYLIESLWFNRWKKYVGYDSLDVNNVGDTYVHPGPIDNSGLFSDQMSQALENLMDKLDYFLIPMEAWNKLVSWYSCLEGQRPIVRKVVALDAFVKYCKVEVYLLGLDLCENDMENVITRHFSKDDTIGTIEKEMRKLFNIPLEKETRLWNRNMGNTFEQLTKLQGTVQDNGLFHGQLIVIQPKNDDGTWPTRPSKPKTKTFRISAKVQEDDQPMAAITNDMFLSVKQSNPFTPKAPKPYSLKVKDAAKDSCLLPLNHFWYIRHVYKERFKHIERKNKIKIVAQVHVTFESEQEDGRTHEALCEFADLSQTCSVESGKSVIPIKFVDPDQWSDALKVIKRSKDILFLTMSSEEVIVSGPKQSQDEFSAVLNAIQKTNTLVEQRNPPADDTSVSIINLITDQQAKYPTEEKARKQVEDGKMKAKSDKEGKNEDKEFPIICSLKPILKGKYQHKKPVPLPPRKVQPCDQIPLTKQQKVEMLTERRASGDSKQLGPICLDKHIKEKQLRCKHTFCDECLKAYWTHVSCMQRCIWCDGGRPT